MIISKSTITEANGREIHATAATYQLRDITEALALSSKQVGADKNDYQRHGSPAQMGTATYPEAYQLASVGWPDGLAKAEALRVQLGTVLGQLRDAPKVVRSVAGFYPCVPAALADDPESMYGLDRIRRPGSGKIVHVVANLCASWGIAGETLILRGAVALALIDALESSGYRCQITVATGLKNSASHVFMVPIKEADDTMNPDTLAFWLAHPATYRRIFWGLWNNVHAKGEFNSHGMPSEIAPEHQGDIYLSAAHLERVNDQTAVQYLKDTLLAYGVEFES